MCSVLRQLAQQVEDLFGGAGIQVAGRLVGHDERRIGDDRPGNAHALLLAAGELPGPVADAVGQPDQLQGRRHLLLAAGRPTAASSNSGSSTFSYAVSTGSRW